LSPATDVGPGQETAVLRSSNGPAHPSGAVHLSSVLENATVSRPHQSIARWSGKNQKQSAGLNRPASCSSISAARVSLVEIQVVFLLMHAQTAHTCSLRSPRWQTHLDGSSSSMPEASTIACAFAGRCASTKYSVIRVICVEDDRFIPAGLAFAERQQQANHSQHDQ
jgi:hypothetical protein